MKRFLCMLLLLALLCAAASAEGGAANWYEVFVRSYQDSDGDGLGDLNGLASRLDYIQDMGFDGLWLMPVMPSPSYHKYDVTDYRAVDGEYGTLEDMRDLVEACHERGISVIADMPVNHTSTRHPWFLEAVRALAAGEESAYIGYYSFSQTGGAGYVPLEGTDWYYEERFAGGGMPDLNLDNAAVMAEIRGIFDFWLNDVGVDGFRLDAVTSYFTGDAEKNIALLAQFKAMAEELKPGSLLIGECWENLSTIARYYESGADGFFLFPAAQAEGFIAGSLRSRLKPAEKFAAAYQKVLDAIPEASLVPFLCNHDTGRTVGLVQGRSNPDVCKFVEGVLGMLNGRVFIYYGEEIGMVGIGNDPSKRAPMYWNAARDNGTTNPPPECELPAEYALGSLEEQVNDDSSIYNYYRQAIAIRNALPVIARGRVTAETGLNVGCISAQRKTWGDEECIILMNISPEAGSADLSAYADWSVAATLSADGGEILLEGTELKLPAYGVAVLLPNS